MPSCTAYPISALTTLLHALFPHSTPSNRPGFVGSTSLVLCVDLQDALMPRVLVTLLVVITDSQCEEAVRQLRRDLVAAAATSADCLTLDILQERLAASCQQAGGSSVFGNGDTSLPLSIFKQFLLI
jgi:hypothetical protein